MRGLSAVLQANATLAIVLFVSSAALAASVQGGAPPAVAGGSPAIVSVAWERLGLVVDLGPPGSYDSAGALNPFVLKDGGTYRMWYRGSDGMRNRILYATSSDGLVWTKHGVAIDVLTAPYYFDGAAAQSVMKEGSTYKMWFGGGFWSGPYGLSGQIYYAESTDAATWSFKGVALPEGAAGSWDGGVVQYPNVMKDASGTYWLSYGGWSGYEGQTTRLGLASSSDGIRFTRTRADPTLDRGAAGSWDSYGINMPFLLSDTPGQMWYSGGDNVHTAIGVAFSFDGSTWIKRPDNPEFSAGPAGTWEGVGVLGESLLRDGFTLYMYYTGNDGSHLRIGLARRVALATSSGNGMFDSRTPGARYLPRPVQPDLEARGSQGTQSDEQEISTVVHPVATTPARESIPLSSAPAGTAGRVAGAPAGRAIDPIDERSATR